MARRRFFVDQVRDGRAELVGDAARRLTRVLRAESGQRYEVSDHNSVYLAEIEEARKDRVAFRILERLETPRPPVRLTLYAALIKFDRFELLVEKATELMAERIVPVEAARSDKGLAEAGLKRVDRWRRIARESSQQSRRVQVPRVDEPRPMADVWAERAAYRYLLAETPEAPTLLALLPPPEVRKPADEVALAVGPEGGWTGGECEAFSQAGWVAVSLGPAILRAETAALAGMAVLVSAWGQAPSS